MPRYKYIDGETGQVLSESNYNRLGLASKIVAQHYKYVRCTRASMMKLFKISGTKRDKVFMWLLKHSRSRMFVGSQRKLAKQAHVSLYTFQKVLAMLKVNKLVVIYSGHFVLSPTLFFTGNDYHFIKYVQMFDNEYRIKYGNKNNRKQLHKMHKSKIKQSKKAKINKNKNRNDTQKSQVNQQ